MRGEGRIISMRAVWVLIALAAAWGQDTGSIEGVVTNATTHAPVSNGRVVLDRAGANTGPPRIAMTHPSGAYRVDELPSGDYVVTFTADAYVATSSPVVRVSSAAVLVNAALFPASSLHGRVFDDEGPPAA